MTADRSWPQTLTSVQGALIAHHREAAGLKHKDLIRSLGLLGIEMQRTTLINIEQGRRKALTVPEIYAFSYALRIPPILLLVPLGNVDQVEILAGRSVPTWVAAQWVRGDGLVDAPSDQTIPEEGELRADFNHWLEQSEVLSWHIQLDRSQQELLALRQREDEFGPDWKYPGDADGPNLSERIETVKFTVQHLRDTLRQNNLIPPPIWSRVATKYPEIN